MEPIKPSLYYPLNPISINQPFGANVAYYEANFGQKGHPGIDFAAAHGEPVYAAHDGEVIYIKDAHGGEGIWNYAPGYITIYWHLIGDTDPKFPTPFPYDSAGVRRSVKKGDLIGYADNTGAPFESSGDHLHFALMLTDANGIVLNQDNGTQGCIDPAPYLNAMYANPLQEIHSEAQTAAADVAKLSPSDPNAPQEESLLGQVIEKIGEEIGLIEPPKTD